MYVYSLPQLTTKAEPARMPEKSVLFYNPEEVVLQRTLENLLQGLLLFKVRAIYRHLHT
jgi:hypothetical protein